MRSLVSVIVPDYNHALYISDAIRSVLNQEYRDFEIIVVDDGSTDNSREMVAQFDNKVRYIWQENRGLSAARNTGIRGAKGEYIALLDADDMYEPAFLTSLLTLLEANPDAEAAYCGYQFVDQLSSPLPQRETRLVPFGRLYQSLLLGNFLVPEAILVRQRCYEIVGLFDESLSACEDWDLWLRISRAHRVLGTSEVLTRHRVLAGSMSSDPARMLANRIAVLNKCFRAEIPDHLRGNLIQEQAYGRVYVATAAEYLQHSDLDQAYQCLRTALKICPDLLTELEIFYELGYGDQPRGFRGDFSSLDVQRNALVLMELLDRAFDDPELDSALKDRRSVAYGNAYLTLGLLSYGTRRLEETRRFLSLAAASNPKCIFHQRRVSLLLKSFLGAAGINCLRDTWRGLRNRLGRASSYLA